MPLSLGTCNFLKLKIQECIKFPPPIGGEEFQVYGEDYHVGKERVKSGEGEVISLLPLLKRKGGGIWETICTPEKQ